VNAEVLLMKEYSAHGDFGDILKFLFSQDKEKIKKMFLVHGETKAMEKFKQNLEEAEYKNIEIAAFRMSYEV
nr:MBL fold metallo-hydrolase [Bacteroidota bacterium]